MSNKQKIELAWAEYAKDKPFVSRETIAQFAAGFDSRQREIDDLLDALKAIAKDAPIEEPEIYYGNNHGDSYANGGEMAIFRLAQIARAAIAKTEGGQP